MNTAEPVIVLESGQGALFNSGTNPNGPGLLISFGTVSADVFLAQRVGTLFYQGESIMRASETDSILSGYVRKISQDPRLNRFVLSVYKKIEKSSISVWTVICERNRDLEEEVATIEIDEFEKSPIEVRMRIITKQAFDRSGYAEIATQVTAH